LPIPSGKGTSWQPPLPWPSAPRSGNGPIATPVPPENRTTALPVYRAGYYQLIASPAKAAPVRGAAADDGGWQAAQD
jgi:hypothetical protein